MEKNHQISPSSRKSFIAIIRSAFVLQNKPLPFTKAILAAVCAAFPLLIGIMLGYNQYGLYAGLGGFTYLYMFNEPLALRAKKLFFVLVSLSISVGLGTLLAPIPLASAIAVGVISAFITFVFGALKISGPAAVFFVLVFTVTTAMDINPAEAPLRAGLVFLGGAFSWLVAMVPWIFNPHGIERKSVQNAYIELANFADTIGTDHYNKSRENIVMTLQMVEETLVSGYSAIRRNRDDYKRLLLLNEQANSIYLLMNEHAGDSNKKLPSEISATLREIAKSIGMKKTKRVFIAQPEKVDKDISQIFQLIYDADATMNEPMSKINRDMKMMKLPVLTILGGAFDKHSIIFTSALRNGIVITIAAIIAYYFNFDRSYWVILTTAAVMLGSTIVSTFHRTIQRSIGTVIGLFIATVILSAQPQGLVIVLAIFTFTFFTELFIVKNYALASIFLTPTTMIMAEFTTQIHDTSYFASARLIDTLTGCAIGIIGTLLIGRKKASSLLPHLMAKTIRSQSRFIFKLYNKGKTSTEIEENKQFKIMQTNLSNLKLMYVTAIGEIPNDKKTLSSLWPIIFSIEQLAYLLTSSLKHGQKHILKDEDMAQLLYIFETMATAVESNRSFTKKPVPEIAGYSKIKKEIEDLQNALYLVVRSELDNGGTFH